MIYLDNAATTMQKPYSVALAVTEAMCSMGNAGRGAGKPALTASRGIYEARKQLAEFFGAGDPSGLVFTANSTEALNIAIHGLFSAGDHVITTEAEHNSVLRPLFHEADRGLALTIIPIDDQGNISYEAMEAAIQDKTKAIVCTHCSNVTGNIFDLCRIGDIAKRHGLLFLVDASQTAGAAPIDVEAMHIDVLCFTGHKGLYGPQGTGGIYVKPGIAIRPLLQGGSGVHSFSRSHPSEMPTALEAGTLNGPGIAGLLAGLSFIEQETPERIAERERMLASSFYQKVCQIPGVKVYGDFSPGRARGPIVALNIDSIDSSEISSILMEEYQIVTRSGAHCAPLVHERLGTRQQGMVRFSFSWFNTEEEVELAAAAIKELAADFVEA